MSEQQFEQTWTQFVKLIVGMSTDVLMGKKYPDKKTYVSNLKMMAEDMEEMLPMFEKEDEG